MLDLDITELLDNINKISTDDLHRLMNAIKCELPVRENNLSGLVDYIPDFCGDEVLMETLWAECESLTMANTRRKATTQWLSPIPDPYVYPDSNPVHKAKDIGEFPGINSLLSIVNASSQIDGPLNCALIIKYSTGDASLSLHADDEDIFDHSKAICSFSIGSSRTLEFYTKAAKPKPVKSVRTDNNGLLIMRPGTQDRLKHCVRPDQLMKGTVRDHAKPGVRYAISFRALAKPPMSGVALTTPPKPVPIVNPQTHSSPPPKRKICLIAGDSFAARLDTERLGKGRVAVETVAKGGAKIRDTCHQIEGFFTANPDVFVDKLFVSVGTNDIRNCHNGVYHLKGPLKQLSKTIKNLSPGSRVFFQSLLPLPVRGSDDWETNAKICEFNIVLYDNCTYNRYFYIDAYVPFRNARKRGYPDTRKDKFFEVGDIHPSKNKGMGVLASLYIRAIHSRYFNPYIFQ